MGSHDWGPNCFCRGQRSGSPPGDQASARVCCESTCSVRRRSSVVANVQIQLVAWYCIRLPGISGLDFQRELAETNIQIPIIFIAAHGDIPMAVRAMKAGAVEFLTQPFRHQDLLDAIQQALGGGTGRDAHTGQKLPSCWSALNR